MMLSLPLFARVTWGWYTEYRLVSVNVQGYHLLPEPAREASVSCAAALARGCQLSAAQTLWLTACGIVASGASDSLATIHDPATQQQQAAVSAAVLAVLPAPAVRLHCSAVDSGELIFTLLPCLSTCSHRRYICQRSTALQVMLHRWERNVFYRATCMPSESVEP